MQLQARTRFPRDVLIRTIALPQSMCFPVYIRGNHQDVHTRALIDSGASGLFIHWNFVRKHRIPTKTYAKPKIVRNADNSANILGKITNYVETHSPSW